jgi:hypothetical protein
MHLRLDLSLVCLDYIHPVLLAITKEHLRTCPSQAVMVAIQELQLLNFLLLLQQDRHQDHHQEALRRLVCKYHHLLLQGRGM